MMNLLVLKERMIKFYQKSEFYLKPVIKFVAAFLVFTFINGQIGYDGRLTGFPVVLLLSLLGAFTPSSVLVLLAAAVSAVHIYFASKILAVLAVAILLILYLLFARFTPKLGYVLLAVPVLFIIKLPYVVPILMGMLAAPAAIVPTGCGIVVYYLFGTIREAASATVNSSVEDILGIYRYVIDSLLSNREMFLALGVFSAVLLITYLIRRSKLDYSFYIAIGAGVFTNILGNLIGDLQMNITNQIGTMILSSVASGLIVFVIQFFRLTLDYTAVERTQFEDDEYYYYVKAVPKMKITAPQKNVTKINVQKSTGDTGDLSQAIHRASGRRDNRDDLLKNYLRDFERDEADEEPGDFDDYSDLEPYETGKRRR